LSGALAAAEACRAAGDWAGAAEAYAAHLAAMPDDFAAWVQHGHCVKEAGDPAAALASYRQAARGMAEDADLHLQIGHALKLAGDPAAAREAYRRALRLDPTLTAAWREVVALLPAAAPPGPAADAGLSLLDDPVVAFDLSDLMAWFGRARAPTGIQRVQMQVVGAALMPGAPFRDARLVVFRPGQGSWRGLPPEAFWVLAGMARAGADAADPAWLSLREEVSAMLDAAPDIAFGDGEWLVNLGSSWSQPGYHAALRAARARTGLRYAALVHDLGPILLPEHSEPATSARFARWFAALGVEADLLLAVSAATRGDMLRLAAQALPGMPFAPVRVLRPDARPVAAPAAAPHPRMSELAGQPYVLFVGTIESRKDHLFVLNAWLALLRRHGDALPPLVLAGRAGFEAGPALALLQRATALQGRVLWLDDVDDGALAALYRGALFCLYHSRFEGWGLPVTEALAAGKAVVTPAHSGLVEAAQGLALHYAAGSEPDFIAAIEALLFEPGRREAIEARIAAGAALRDWEAVAGDLSALLAGAAAAPPPGPPAPPLGIVHGFAEAGAAMPTPAMVWTERMRDGDRWHAPEGWGCWTRPGAARLVLPLPAGAGAPLRLHVALRGAPTARLVTLRVGRGARHALEIAADARQVVALDLPRPDAPLVVTLEAMSEDGIGIGVTGVMVCAPDDLAARVALLESLGFVWPARG
jgi:glycosyltransferase involved in cell wall biosynthesis